MNGDTVGTSKLKNQMNGEGGTESRFEFPHDTSTDMKINEYPEYESGSGDNDYLLPHDHNGHQDISSSRGGSAAYELCECLVGTVFGTCGVCGNRKGYITENKGSLARDHLANERTFLAWLRTSLGSVGLGVAVAKLDSSRYAQVSGCLFIAVGALFLLYSTLRYFKLLHLLDEGYFEANKFGVGLLVTLAAIATIVAITIVIL
jgi:uncharacterized membrane protein YidH (DUF202 family)